MSFSLGEKLEKICQSYNKFNIKKGVTLFIKSHALPGFAGNSVGDI